jgi:SAM-dependent methyltransferase
MPTAARRRPRGLNARRADKYELYQRSVQQPEADVSLLRRIYRTRTGRAPRDLREDFCGTALLACEWVRRIPNGRAWGIDLDPEPLEWGRERNLGALPPAKQQRVHLLQADVRSARTPPVDITVAFNFSYFLFKTRPALLAYFEKARTTLRRGGLFAIDVYGGADAQRRQTETREIEGFDYEWDQDLFDPITHDVTNYIHFNFPDGSRLRRAFTYEWRLWSLPELQELLSKAGFRDVAVYWENTDTKTNEGNGVFTRREHAPDDPAWIAYVAGVR